MRMTLVYVITAGLCLPRGALADTVENAYALCRVIDGTGLSSSPCSVSGGQQAVTATIDMVSSEARKLCAQVAGLMREKRMHFDTGWRLQIKSPYSGSNTIAFCQLSG